MKINVHIERVILDGVEVDHPIRFRRSLEKELARRLKEGGVSAEFRQGGIRPYVAGGAIRLNEGHDAARLGTQIAGAAYHGIGGRR
jgi:hypothetical protein